MLVYGRNVARELLVSNRNIKKVYLQDNFSDENINYLLQKNKYNIKVLSKKQIDDFVDGNHQGIILDIEDYQYSNLDDILKENCDFLVVLDHIEDPHNLGAIIRTCEAAGVDGIIIPKDRQVSVNSTVMKTSAGALTNVKIVKVTNLVNTLKKLKKENFWVVGTSLKDSTDYTKIDYSSKTVLVIGNEGKGMSRLVEEECDFIAKIPMYGKVNSLNASVASGIMIYEVVRNRK